MSTPKPYMMIFHAERNIEAIFAINGKQKLVEGTIKNIDNQKKEITIKRAATNLEQTFPLEKMNRVFLSETMLDNFFFISNMTSETDQYGNTLLTTDRGPVIKPGLIEVEVEPPESPGHRSWPNTYQIMQFRAFKDPSADKTHDMSFNNLLCLKFYPVDSEEL